MHEIVASDIYLFADDDTKVPRAIKTDEDPKMLQNYLDSIYT